MKTLIIKWPLCDLNKYIEAERTNKFMASKIKKGNTEYVYNLAVEKWGLRPRTIKKPVFVAIDWYAPDRKKDKDNIAFAKKFILDGLVMAKVLKNDGWEDISDFSDTFHLDKKNPRIEVMLEEVEGNIDE